MNSLVVEGFQYPENPSWNVQEDEIQGMVDRIQGAKRIWPVLSILRIFVPLLRDILCGFIDEEEGQPAGLINYMRQRNTPEWYIGNVTVLPTGGRELPGSWCRRRWRSFGGAKPGLPSWRWLLATTLPLIYTRIWGSRNLRSLPSMSSAGRVFFFRNRFLQITSSER